MSSACKRHLHEVVKEAEAKKAEAATKRAAKKKAKDEADAEKQAQTEANASKVSDDDMFPDATPAATQRVAAPKTKPTKRSAEEMSSTPKKIKVDKPKKSVAKISKAEPAASSVMQKRPSASGDEPKKRNVQMTWSYDSPKAMAADLDLIMGALNGVE